MACAETISAHRLYHGQVLRIVWVEMDGSVHAKRLYVVSVQW